MKIRISRSICSARLIILILLALASFSSSKKNLESSKVKSNSKFKKQFNVSSGQPQISYIKASGVVEADEVKTLNPASINRPIMTHSTSAFGPTARIEPTYQNVSIVEPVIRQTQTPVLSSTNYFSTNSKNVVIEDNNARMNLNYIPSDPYGINYTRSGVGISEMNLKKTPSGSILLNQPLNLLPTVAQAQPRIQQLFKPQFPIIRPTPILPPSLPSSEIVVHDDYDKSEFISNPVESPLDNSNIDKETINRELMHIKTEMNASHFDNSTKLISNLLMAIENRTVPFSPNEVNAWYSTIEQIILDSKIKIASFVKSKVPSRSTRLNRLLNRLKNPNSELILKRKSKVFVEDPLGLPSS